MKIIDAKFKQPEINLLKDMVGKNITSIEHDAFVFTNTSSQIVQINIGEEKMYIYNFAEENDYYGVSEDVGIMSFEDTRYPAVDLKKFITLPIGDVVKKIIVVQEHQKLYEKEIQTYDVSLTRGIIIDFGTYQVSFEKAVWFSEDIIVRKGYNLAEEFAPIEQISKTSNWQDGTRMECTRSLDVVE